MVIKVFEVLRIVCTGVGFFLGFYYGRTPGQVIHILTPWVVGSIAGFTGLQALFFPEESTKALGWKTNPYHMEVGLFCMV